MHGQQTCKKTHVNIRNLSHRSGVACCLCYVRPACHAKVGLTRFLVCQILMEHLPPQLLLAKSYNMRYKKKKLLEVWLRGVLKHLEASVERAIMRALAGGCNATCAFPRAQLCFLQTINQSTQHLYKILENTNVCMIQHHLNITKISSVVGFFKYSSL